MPLTAGTRIGPYEIVARLSARGMGEVYRARDARLDRDVAIKALLGDSASDPVIRRRFLQEARAASALSHPNIVVLHDIVNHDGSDFLVMEYVLGQPLSEVMDQGPMPFERVIAIGLQVASALAAAHAGNLDEAFRWLERAYEERSPWLVYLSREHRLRHLRGNPRFDALVARIQQDLRRSADPDSVTTRVS